MRAYPVIWPVSGNIGIGNCLHLFANDPLVYEEGNDDCKMR